MFFQDFKPYISIARIGNVCVPHGWLIYPVDQPVIPMINRLTGCKMVVSYRTVE